jgi:hypothetical protein
MRFVSQITLSPKAVFFEGNGKFFSNLLSINHALLADC